MRARTPDCQPHLSARSIDHYARSSPPAFWRTRLLSRTN